jgi:phosphoglycerate dehydrogenase-like enzyme
MTSDARPIVVIPADDPLQIAESPHLERLRAVAEVRLHRDWPADDDDQLRRARDAHVILNSRGQLNWPGRLLRSLSNLRFITACGIGTDSLDVETATELGIIVSNIPGRTAPVVAEHALALMLGAAKRLAFQTAELQAGKWNPVEIILLRGKTLGVVGTGSIGAATARLAAAIGMNVIAWTFNPTAERARELNVRYVELDELLTTSDVVSLHLKLTPQSRHLIGRRELSLMKPGSLLVNTARGNVVDMQALVAVLQEGRLAGAALDVFDIEPLPADHPILGCPHVILTPHNADQTPEGIDILNGGAVDNVLAFLRGTPQNVVTGRAR